MQLCGCSGTADWTDLTQALLKTSMKCKSWNQFPTETTVIHTHILTTAEKSHRNIENNNDENLERLLFSIPSAKRRTDTKTRHLRFKRSESSI